MRAYTVVAILSLIAWVARSVALPVPAIKFERAGDRTIRRPPWQGRPIPSSYLSHPPNGAPARIRRPSAQAPAQAPARAPAQAPARAPAQAPARAPARAPAQAPAQAPELGAPEAPPAYPHPYGSPPAYLPTPHEPPRPAPGESPPVYWKPAEH